jgi:hypothetical protein
MAKIGGYSALSTGPSITDGIPKAQTTPVMGMNSGAASFPTIKFSNDSTPEMNVSACGIDWEPSPEPAIEEDELAEDKKKFTEPLHHRDGHGHFVKSNPNKRKVYPSQVDAVEPLHTRTPKYPTEDPNVHLGKDGYADVYRAAREKPGYKALGHSSSYDPDAEKELSRKGIGKGEEESTHKSSGRADDAKK